MRSFFVTFELLVSCYRTQVRFCFSAVCDFLFLFVCASNISGNAQRICAKFTGKTSLVPCRDEFECKDQRPKVKVTRDKKQVSALPSPPGSDGMVPSAA